MIISRGRDSSGVSSRRDPEHYSGRVWADFIAQTTEPNGGVRILTVFHEPGSRSHWHSHSSGQVLFVTGGEGRVANKNGETVVVRAGDCVYTPPGEMHWHGAAPNTIMQELAISIGTVEWPVDRLVTDEQYHAGFDAADAEKAK